MSRMDLNLKRLKHGLKQAKELEEAVKELKNKLDSTIKTVEGQTRIDDLNANDKGPEAVLLPIRYLKEDTLLFALTLDEAQTLIELTDGVEDSIATILSEQSLKQAKPIDYGGREAPEEWWEDPAYEEAIAFMQEKLGEGTVDQFIKDTTVLQTDDFEEWLNLTRSWVAEKAVNCIAVIDKFRELPRKMGDNADRR